MKRSERTVVITNNPITFTKIYAFPTKHIPTGKRIKIMEDISDNGSMFDCKIKLTLEDGTTLIETDINNLKY